MSPTEPRRRGATALAVAAGVAVATVAAAGYRRRAMAERVREYESRVAAGGVPAGAKPFEPADVADLPAPVRRYFETVLSAGQRPVTGLRLGQDGEFAFGADWHPFTADRYRQDVDAEATWTGRYWACEERDGMVVPTAGEAVWDTLDGEQPYWRGRIPATDYRFDRVRGGRID